MPFSLQVLKINFVLLDLRFTFLKDLFSLLRVMNLILISFDNIYVWVELLEVIFDPLCMFKNLWFVAGQDFDISILVVLHDILFVEKINVVLIPNLRFLGSRQLHITLRLIFILVDLIWILSFFLLLFILTLLLFWNSLWD